MRPRIYIAGPLTDGGTVADPRTVAGSVEAAIQAGIELIGMGMAPLIPHLSYFMDKGRDHIRYDTWIEVDLEWLAVADAVLRLPGSSRGADRETAFAMERGIPIFYSVHDLCRAMHEAIS